MDLSGECTTFDIFGEGCIYKKKNPRASEDLSFVEDYARLFFLDALRFVVFFFAFFFAMVWWLASDWYVDPSACEKFHSRTFLNIIITLKEKNCVKKINMCG